MRCRLGARSAGRPAGCTSADSRQGRPRGQRPGRTQSAWHLGTCHSGEHGSASLNHAQRLPSHRPHTCAINTSTGKTKQIRAHKIVPRYIRKLARVVAAERKVDEDHPIRLVEHEVVRANVPMVQTSVVHGLQCKKHLAKWQRRKFVSPSNGKRVYVLGGGGAAHCTTTQAC